VLTVDNGCVRAFSAIREVHPRRHARAPLERSASSGRWSRPWWICGGDIAGPHRVAAAHPRSTTSARSSVGEDRRGCHHDHDDLGHAARHDGVARVFRRHFGPCTRSTPRSPVGTGSSCSCTRTETSSTSWSLIAIGIDASTARWRAWASQSSAGASRPGSTFLGRDRPADPPRPRDPG